MVNLSQKMGTNVSYKFAVNTSTKSVVSRLSFHCEEGEDPNTVHHLILERSSLLVYLYPVCDFINLGKCKNRHRHRLSYAATQQCKFKVKKHAEKGTRKTKSVKSVDHLYRLKPAQAIFGIIYKLHVSNVRV